jgi:ectoine hydroxylase-related dioxygenase (phytanoyl-CoA dioxygenase family)
MSVAEFDAATADPARLQAAWKAEGHVILRKLFDPARIAEIAAAFDTIQKEARAHGRSFRHGNLLYTVQKDANLGSICRMVQWPSYHNRALNALRLDPRMAWFTGLVLGPSTKQIINQMHWKPGGAAVNDFAWHQDCRFRTPAHAYRDLENSYAQIGLAIDPHEPASGGMRFVRRSHLRGDLHMGSSGRVMEQRMCDEALVDAGLDPADAFDVVLAPGDAAAWSPFMVHGSGPNNAHHQRRLYINGYIRADACDRGEWAFRDGEAVAFGAEPALVHYEQLRERPEPHYVDDANLSDPVR